MQYLDLFRCLEQYRVRYLLVGGLAMNLHGVPRMTMDIDIVLVLDADNLRNFFAVARELDLAPQAPVALEQLADPDERRRWMEEKGMIAFALRGPDPAGPTLDIVIRHPLGSEAFDRPVIRLLGDIPVRLAALDDMITLKTIAGRRQDMDDIEHLQRLRGDSNEG